jgi:glyoxylase-like metal-dependent hydrolase (beta-lactamase superfamily II)
MQITFWGTRGSIPAPGPETMRYGGNTSCVEVRLDNDTRIIFDAGTGIRLLGDKLAGGDDPVRATVFLTHFHWDHIQGFPFFAPLYDPDARLTLMGPRQKDLDIQTLFARQMGPVYFPVPLEALAADRTFDHLSDDGWVSDEGIRIRSMRVRHPSHTVGYRLEAGGKTICYVPDNELEGGEYPVEAGWRDRLTERPLIRLKVTPQDAPIYGAFFGTAAIVRGLDFVRRKIYPKGWPNWLAHSAAVVIILFAGIFNRNGPNSPVRGDVATVELEDGPKIRCRHFLIMATTLNRLILGLKPFPSGEPGLKVISVKYAVPTIIKGMVATLFGRLNGKAPDGMIASRTQRAWIHIDCPVTLDGEFFTPMPDAPIEISSTRPVTFLRIGES